MNKIKNMIKQKINLLTYIVLILILSSCQSPKNKTNVDDNIKVTSINKIQITEEIADFALQQACKNWTLSKEQIKQFFLLSEVLENHAYNQFYQLPCSINGELISNGKTWNFTINAGATAQWTTANNNQTIYLGCKKTACETLVLLPYDGMNPE